MAGHNNNVGLDNSRLALNNIGRDYTARVQLSEMADDFSNPSFDSLNGMGNLFDFGSLGSMGNLGGFGGLGGFGYSSGNLQQQFLMNKTYNAANFKMAASEKVLASRVGALDKHVMNNEQDKVMSSYNKLYAAIKNKYDVQTIDENGNKIENVYKPTDEEIRAEADTLYYETTGKVLEDDIDENGDNSFLRGAKQGAFGVGWLFTNKNSKENSISHITNESESTSSKVAHAAGITVSALATVALVPLLFTGGKNGVKLYGGFLKKLYGKTA